MATYTVQRGDTLSEIAVRFNTTTAALASLNDISNVNRIYVGEVLTVSGSAPASTSTSTTKATVNRFGLQSDTDRTVFATWKWTRSHTKEYRCVWYYDTGNGVWFVGSDSTETNKQSVYTAPSNATKVKFRVKPVSTTHTVNKKEVVYWTATWSTDKQYAFSSNPPTTPPVPTVTVDNLKLTASLSNLDVNGTQIQFQVVKNDATQYKIVRVTIKTNAASYTCSLAAGTRYKVRCRAIRGSLVSDWSEYSTNYSTRPATPTGVKIKGTSETAIQLSWTAVSTATSYEMEYTTNKNYFNGSDGTSTVNGIETTRYEKTGLESGETYFARVRAVNDQGESGWSSIVSVIIGEAPEAPTTYSSTTTVIVGDPLYLYWVHNSKDESNMRTAQLQIYVNNVLQTQTVTIANVDDDEEEETHVYTFSTSSLTEGAQIKWRVRTAGITGVFGDWSIQRTVDVYAPPTLELSLTNVDGDDIDVIESFPFYINGISGPNTQTPIGYHVTILSNESYETVDEIGNVKMVNSGDEVYSKYYDNVVFLVLELSAGSIDLENNKSYTIQTTVAMNSGLNVTEEISFTVSWTDEEYEPNAEISVDEDSLEAIIHPYCDDENGDLIVGVTLAVYRREFDGTFTEIASGLANTNDLYVTDPHPALDYARYRIVATTVSTGAVSYYDVPGYPVGEKSVVIQWEEEWSEFDTSSIDEADSLEEPNWSGSMIRLPYNVDVSDDYSVDVELVEYIGRSHPVSYYGTQVGSTSNWNVSIAKNDENTLYALRRLAIWPGDVYVREPSGSGYWASVSISFSQSHGSLVIPVSIDVKRVVGGI